MPVYTFYLHETADRIPAFEIGQFDELEHALAHGERLLRERPRYRYIEVTRDEESVARLTRPGLQPAR